MVDRLIDYFIGVPRRLVTLGAVLVRLGGFLMVAGLVGQVGTTAVSVVKGLGGGARLDVPLAEVFPGYLSFWMPESVFGFGVALLLLAAGVMATRTGRMYERFMGA
jgi:hypothetical protein